MNSDIRLKVTFPNHHKTKKLYRKLGAQGPLSLIYLWLYAAGNKPDGMLVGMDEDDIAIAAQWDGDALKFIDALIGSGFLENNGDGYFIHDWVGHNAWAANASVRSDKAAKAAKARWDKRNGVTGGDASTMRGDATSMEIDATSINEDAPSNAPSPIPSPSPLPIPSLKDKPLSAVASVALEIILQDETFFPVTEEDIADWYKIFPKVDVVGILTEIQKTCTRNPHKRKDSDNVRGHIVGCLKMLNERGESFERIWKRYPAKDGKKEAERHFKATVHTEEDLREIHQALDRYLAMLKSNPKRPPKNGSTWFNNWKDWVEWEDPKGIQGGIDDDFERALQKADKSTEYDIP